MSIIPDKGEAPQVCYILMCQSIYNDFCPDYAEYNIPCLYNIAGKNKDAPFLFY